MRGGKHPGVGSPLRHTLADEAVTFLSRLEHAGGRGVDPQVYGIGIKELRKIDPAKTNAVADSARSLSASRDAPENQHRGQHLEGSDNVKPTRYMPCQSF
jgi:hypothetical protein